MFNKILYYSFILVLVGGFALLYSPLPSLADDRMTPGDPMVKITTMPTTIDLKQTMAKISEDVAKSTGLPENFVTYYWQFFENMYCPGCEKAGVKEVIFIDLYTPGFLAINDRQIFMISLAQAIANHTPYGIKDIYLHTHIAEKDQLFIMGDIITNWKQVGGPDDGNE
jgi:hypothetical protein